MKKTLIALFTLFLVLSEIILRYNTTLGFVFYGILTLGCLIALSRNDVLNENGELLTVFLILPAVRIAELFISLSYPWNIFVAYYILFFLVVYYSVRFKVEFGKLKKGIYLLPLTIIIGLIIGITGNWLFAFQKSMDLLLILPLVAFSEEALFRGLLQGIAEKSGAGAFIPILCTSLLYGVFSLTLGLWAAVFMFAVSMILGYMYNKTGNLWINMTINLVMQIVLFA